LAVAALNTLGQDVLPRNEDVRIDGAVLAYTGLVSLAAGILFGILPAWRSLDVAPGEVLQAGARSVGDARGRRTRSFLGAAEGGFVAGAPRRGGADGKAPAPPRPRGPRLRREGRVDAAARHPAAALRRRGPGAAALAGGLRARRALLRRRDRRGAIAAGS